jgi:hypothetical protein
MSAQQSADAPEALLSEIGCLGFEKARTAGNISGDFGRPGLILKGLHVRPALLEVLDALTSHRLNGAVDLVVEGFAFAQRGSKFWGCSFRIASRILQITFRLLVKAGNTLLGFKNTQIWLAGFIQILGLKECVVVGWRIGSRRYALLQTLDMIENLRIVDGAARATRCACGLQPRLHFGLPD